jgi:two-component system phosphate regulon response regulator PhoB
MPASFQLSSSSPAMTDSSTTRPLIFVLEDELDICRLICLHLIQGGYAVREFATTTNFIHEAILARPSLILLDIMVPGGDGLDICRRIRQNPEIASIPIVFVTARTSEQDRVLGLELGADDYITKPFSPRELLARIKAVLRRFDSPLTPRIAKIGDLEINTEAMVVRVRAQYVPTTATEFRLLDWFVRHPGRVFSRDQLLDAVWRDTQYVTPRSVDVYVRRLREKIETDPENPAYIRTVRGAGYRFEARKPDTVFEN